MEDTEQRSDQIITKLCMIYKDHSGHQLEDGWGCRDIAPISPHALLSMLVHPALGYMALRYVSQGSLFEIKQ